MVGGWFYYHVNYELFVLLRVTVPASTGVLGSTDEDDAVLMINMMYVSPLVSPIRVWLLVLPPSTSTLSMLPPPPV